MLPKQVRRLLRFSTVLSVIFGLVGLWGLMMQFHYFPPAYFVIAMWTGLASLGWMASPYLTKKRPTKRQLRENRRRALLKWRLYQWTFPAVFLLLAAGFSLLTFSDQRYEELARFNGTLFPASDRVPRDACGGASAPGISPNSLRIYTGGFWIVTPNPQMWIVAKHPTVSGPGDVLLGIERQSDGSVVVDARTFGEDGKVVIDIDRNHFEVNRNEILDSLSPPRSDLSTINLRDGYGNTFVIRLMNPNSLFFRGKIFLARGHYFTADPGGLEISGGPQMSGEPGSCILDEVPNDTPLFVM